MVFASVSRPCDVCNARKNSETELGKLMMRIKDKYLEVHYCRNTCLAGAQAKMRKFLEENRKS